MDLTPIWEAPLPVKIHLVTVLPAFIIGTWLIFFSTKGARLHRALGVTYLTLMLTTAAASFFIRSSPSGLSLIHLFIPLTLFFVFESLWQIRRGNITAHRNSMIGLYCGSLILAGAFAFMPGRIMNQVVFGS